jgi:hypothetical protein
MASKRASRLLVISIIMLFVVSGNKVQACVSPNVKVISPETKIYGSNSVPLIFTVDTPTCWIGYVLDGQANVTVNGNTTLTELQDGNHSVIVFAKNKWGTGASGKVDFAVDTTPPDIKDITQFPSSNNVQPQDKVEVNATITDDLSGVKQATLTYTYANNEETGNATVTMSNLEADIWNATIPMFLTGTNVTYAITAEDNVGNTAMSKEIEYNVNLTISELPSPFAALLTIMAVTTALATARLRLPSKKRKRTG